MPLRGEPVQLAAAVGRTAAGRLSVSASRRGDVIYAAGATGDGSEGVWVDRRGVIDASVPPLPMFASGIRLSIDGKLLAYTRLNNRREEIWIYDTVRRVSSPLAPGLSVDATLPVFSPDGSHVYYRRAAGTGDVVIERQAVSGGARPMEVLRAANGEFTTPVAVTLNPPRLLYMAMPVGRRNLWVLPLDGTAKPASYLEQSEARVGLAALSPDNRLVALTIGQGQQAQVFIQTFPDPTQGRWPVSGVGAGYPRWRPDGKELFFRGWRSRSCCLR